MSEEEEKEISQDLPEKEEQAKSETEPTELITKANAAAERLENANKELAKLIAIQQKAAVENTLSGKTNAGVPTISDEEKKQENARKYLKGTGMEEYAFPDAKTDSSYN